MAKAPDKAPEKKPDPAPLGPQIGPGPGPEPEPIPLATGPVVVALLAAAPTTRRARVTIPNTHVGVIDVTIPADAADPARAAVEQAKADRGIVAFGASPQVEFLD